MEQRKTFPLRAKPEEIENPAVRIYGNRFHGDQTVYEYLIEFLLVFASAKTKSRDENGNITLANKLRFHTDTDAELAYFVEPRNGFRRFVFYEQAKKARQIPADEDAYKEIRRVLMERVDADREADKEVFLNAARNLFYGYAVVLKNRSWCAQELLPLCPEMIFCEQMPMDNLRVNGAEKWSEFEEVKEYGYDPYDTFADASFDYNRHNFLARGGELYYLHLLQYLKDKPQEKETLERLLNHLLTDKSAAFRKLASWIQETWEANRDIDPEYLSHKMPMGYIPAGAYEDSGKCAAKELINYLSSELHPVKRVEILAKGVMFQVMRMQAEQTAEYLQTNRFPLIADMRPGQGGAVIRKIAAESFDALRDAFIEAIQKHLASYETPGKTEEEKRKYAYKLFVNARKESLDVFKGRGKELQCVIPSRGPYERFSLSEDVIRFLTLAIVPPGEKMDMDAFLAELYRRYRLVIGPKEYAQCARSSGLDEELTAAFQRNRDAFQDFLKAVGFLRDLSDATSIVINPYEKVRLT